MRCRRPPILTSVAAVAAASLLVAGCGGGSNSHSSSNSASSAGNATQVRGQYVGFAECMRSHGLSGYPDPVVSASAAHFSVQISPGSADPNSPAFRSANRACNHLLPDGGVQGGPGGSSAQQQAQGVAFADCMRSHGVPSFPDPDHDGVFTLPATINEQAPAFLSASQACPQPSSLSIDQTP
jgi:hypothetical protein